MGKEGNSFGPATHPRLPHPGYPCLFQSPAIKGCNTGFSSYFVPHEYSGGRNTRTSRTQGFIYLPGTSWICIYDDALYQYSTVVHFIITSHLRTSYDVLRFRLLVLHAERSPQTHVTEGTLFFRRHAFENFVFLFRRRHSRECGQRRVSW